MANPLVKALRKGADWLSEREANIAEMGFDNPLRAVPPKKGDMPKSVTRYTDKGYEGAKEDLMDQWEQTELQRREADRALDKFEVEEHETPEYKAAVDRLKALRMRQRGLDNAIDDRDLDMDLPHAGQQNFFCFGITIQLERNIFFK